eukprot:7706417-Ditylum_brightwellii.AAC.1
MSLEYGLIGMMNFSREEPGKCQLNAEVVVDSAYECHVQERYVESFVPNGIVLDDKVTQCVTNPNGFVTLPANKDEVTMTIGRKCLPV